MTAFTLEKGHGANNETRMKLHRTLEVEVGVIFLVSRRQ
jgi:hypothetical protein